MVCKLGKRRGAPAGRIKTWLAPPQGWSITATGSRPNYVSETEIVFDAFTPTGTFWIRLDPRSIPWDG